jgi:general secretion pathway protein G
MKRTILRLAIAFLTFVVGVACVAPYRPDIFYHVHSIVSREAILRDDLFQMRRMIDQHAADKGSLPRSLDDLVKAGYLREIPVDPITEQRDWVVVVMGNDPNAPEEVRAVIDVRSASAQTSSEGTPHSQW